MIKTYSKWAFWNYWKLLKQYNKLCSNMTKTYHCLVAFVDATECGNGIPDHILKQLDEVYPDNTFPGNRL